MSTADTLRTYAHMSANERHVIWQLLWNFQNPGMKRIHRLRDQEPANVFGKTNLLRAFGPLRSGEKLFVGCPDDRCGTEEEVAGDDMHRFCLPGSGVLNPIESAEQVGMQILWKFQEEGVQVIPTWHEHCGACAAYSRITPEEDNAEIVAKRVAAELAKCLGHRDTPLHMGFDNGNAAIEKERRQGVFLPMRGLPDWHDGRKMVVDLSNRLYRSSYLPGLKPFMKLNWYHDDLGVMMQDIDLLLGLMMDPHHGPGHERFKQNEYIILVVGIERMLQKHFPQLSTQAFQAILKNHLAHSPYNDAVQILGFDAPPTADCAEQAAKDDAVL